MLPVIYKTMQTKRLKQIFSKGEDYRKELTDYLRLETQEHGGTYTFPEPPYIMTDTGEFMTILSLHETLHGLRLDAGVTFLQADNLSLRNLVWLTNAVMKSTNLNTKSL